MAAKSSETGSEMPDDLPATNAPPAIQGKRHVDKVGQITTRPAGTRSTDDTKARSRRSLPAQPNRPKLIVAEADAVRQLLRCSACSSANPPDAYYCHFDGKPLFKDLQPTPLAVGSLLFPSPFCFSNGQTCTNFNQLALACNNLWEEARELLTEGIWSMFFAGMGRLDLAAAAKQAAREADPDLGLSQLLEKFPADPEFLCPPKLALGCTSVNLAPLVSGTDYTFDLVIQNRGKLLLHGVVLTNFDWLTFGDAVAPLPATTETGNFRACPQPLPRGPHGGPSRKMFQTRHGCTIPVLVRGDKLRAGFKPLLGEIIVDSNGGTVTLPVCAAIPIRPFPKGVYANDVLAGVRLPRELAVKAKKSPKEAGILFEQGAVKAWYASNGWTYPIEGADGRGTGAVQQFFEALGLTQPPRLEIDRESLAFRGKIGESLSATLTLHTKEGKPVYAQAWSDREWLELGPIEYLGPKVRIPVAVVVPADGGEGQVTIQGNGKQRFVVPVTAKKK